MVNKTKSQLLVDIAKLTELVDKLTAENKKLRLYLSSYRSGFVHKWNSTFSRLNNFLDIWEKLQDEENKTSENYYKIVQ